MANQRSIFFECFKSKKRQDQKYFRIVENARFDGSARDYVDSYKIGHGEGYVKSSSAIHTILLIMEGKFKVEEHTTGKTHTFSLIAKNGEPIFQSNKYKDRGLMDEHIKLIKEAASTADIFFV
jgi:uncharacterized protein YegP (UPF0339 family)